MMENPAKFWNERYAKEEFIYGTQPNVFIKEQLNKLHSGKILFPAEGEGRNAVHAATQGWGVVAFDISEKGREKALGLAKKNCVYIDYQHTDVLDFQSDIKFDAICLCYAHFPAEIRKQVHHHLMQFLRPGGIVIFEGFAKAQLGKPSGGPKNLEMLFSLEEIKVEFPQLGFEVLKEETIELLEGNFHKGKAEVIRFVGIKK